MEDNIQRMTKFVKCNESDGKCSAKCYITKDEATQRLKSALLSLGCPETETDSVVAGLVCAMDESAQGKALGICPADYEDGMIDEAKVRSILYGLESERMMRMVADSQFERKIEAVATARAEMLHDKFKQSELGEES